jgi:hypothetical protein
VVVSVEPGDGPGRYMKETAEGEPGYVEEKEEKTKSHYIYTLSYIYVEEKR